jgi:peptide deformylase
MRRGADGWTVKLDRDAIKEAYLLFATPSGRRFPLYPGQSAWIEYGYSVTDEKWGTWFQRAIRWPTKHFSVRLVFPKNLEPVAWGTETSVIADASPFVSPIVRQEQDDRIVFEWCTENPPLDTRYRLEWEFRNPLTESGSALKVGKAMEITAQMRMLGIRQVGDAVLKEPCQDFDLPAEAEDARRIGGQLTALLDELIKVHVFRKGMGIAAPQVGVPRSVAVIKPPDGERPFLLYNPRVIDHSEEHDERYEGCLSFFDVRGMVPRPLRIQVEHTLIDGSREVSTYERGLARQVLHEIDHLQGTLYTARMKRDAKPIPVSEYQGTGSSWEY